MDLEISLTAYRAILGICVFLAAVHAWTKLSPEFAASWFGSGLVFGWCWAPAGVGPEVVLLPVLVVYEAAAVTKGLVETRDRVRGNHVLHVLMTGALTAILALPWEAVARAASWPRPRAAERELFGLSSDLLGGSGADLIALWALVGLGFYGVFKIIDHSGLPRALQVIVVFGGMPFLARGLTQLHAML